MAKRKPKRVKIQPLLPGRSLPPVTDRESPGEYTVVVPMTGVDPRQVFVTATPDTLLIEIRDRETVNHEGNGPVFSKIQDRRASRELRFRHPIEKGISLRVNRNQLLITCRQAPAREEQSWSELLRLDTRASLGGV
jgi:HSP20 family molecular chaperone IbpA